MVVTTAQHTAPASRRGPAHGRVRRLCRRSGQAPMGGGLLPPVIATAVGARGRFRHRHGNADRPDSDGPPLRGPRPRSSRSITTRFSTKMGQFREGSTPPIGGGASPSNCSEKHGVEYGYVR